MKIIETEDTYVCRCQECLTKLEFNIHDVFSSYVRGLDICEHGWIDCDCVWNYITCPKCNSTISVDNILSREDKVILADKYENS